ncbi:phage gp6-like head-tail connector protein [Weissella ceti]|uniref:Phage gp6-like head-tail connector protein n=1 Tax=Weissella ceti TaxID=759620 RepID=A0ABT3E4A1_9LACO|nr:phage gp6-like head-tail connector protein [Weissella ceti]MCW0953250.1 phage gp6-like head-tail connector protein [Weissella ceti]QVK12766.1 phage gp6-like head-tail connector protein [Weissella ceti]
MSEYTPLSADFTSEKLLDALKEALKLFHDEEDERLKAILDASVELITDFTGVKSLANATYRELIIARAMYVFNDQGEYFFDNYRAEINDLALKTGAESFGQVKA